MRFGRSPLKVLPADEGEVWVGFELDTSSGFTDDHYNAVADRLADLVQAAPRPPKHFPRQPFWVSDEYETIFDRT